MMDATSSLIGTAPKTNPGGPEHREHSADHILQFSSHVSLGRQRPEDVALVPRQGQSDLDSPVT